jgi:hypothetical protein
MKKLILILAVLVSQLSFSQTIYLDQEIIIPIGLGPGGEKLDSIQIVNEGGGFKYTLRTKYNKDREVEEFYTERVSIDNTISENTSLTIRLNKLSETQRSAVLSVVEDGTEAHIDSTVMNYNLSGLQTSSYSYQLDSGSYSVRDSMIWHYPTADAFYSVNGHQDTVFYTATNGKVQLANKNKHDEENRHQYSYNNDGMLTNINQTRKSTGAWEAATNITLVYGDQVMTSNYNNGTSLSVFPNPTTSTIQVRSDNGCKVAIYNLAGNHIKNLNANCNEIINLSGLPKGYYIVKITDNLGGSKVRKVLLR